MTLAMTGRERALAIVPGVVRGVVLMLAAWVFCYSLGAAQILGVGVARPISLLVLCGALLGLTRREAVAWSFATLMAALYLVAGFTPAIPAIGRRLVRTDAVLPVDAVFVLGAALTPEGLIDGASIERVLSALKRVGAGDTTPMVFSVVRESPHAAVTSEGDLRALLALTGGRRAYLLNNVFSTHDEAEGAKTMATVHRWLRVAVLTSPSHTSRACRTFERAGLTVSCWASDERGARTAAATAASERLRAAPPVVYELVGWLVYRIRGWV